MGSVSLIGKKKHQAHYFAPTEIYYFYNTLLYNVQILMSALLASTTVTTMQLVSTLLGALYAYAMWVLLEMEQSAFQVTRYMLM